MLIQQLSDFVLARSQPQAQRTYHPVRLTPARGCQRCSHLDAVRVAILGVIAYAVQVRLASLGWLSLDVVAHAALEQTSLSAPIVRRREQERRIVEARAAEQARMGNWSQIPGRLGVSWRTADFTRSAAWPP